MLLASTVSTQDVHSEEWRTLLAMNILLAANVKCGNTEVKKKIMVTVHVSYDKSIYRHDDVRNYVIVQ